MAIIIMISVIIIIIKTVEGCYPCLLFRGASMSKLHINMLSVLYL